jgi:hypothetical protein
LPALALLPATPGEPAVGLPFDGVVLSEHATSKATDVKHGSVNIARRKTRRRRIHKLYYFFGQMRCYWNQFRNFIEICPKMPKSSEEFGPYLQLRGGPLLALSQARRADFVRGAQTFTGKYPCSKNHVLRRRKFSDELSRNQLGNALDIMFEPV